MNTPHDKNTLPSQRIPFINNNNLISVLALVISLAVAVFTIWNESKKEAITKRQNLTAILDKLIDIDLQTVELNALPMTEEQRDFAFVSFANRSSILLSQAEELYEALKKTRTLEDAAMLSVAHFRLGNYENAESYIDGVLKQFDEMEKSEGASSTKIRIGRATAIRSSAILANLLGNHSKAAKLFKQALGLTTPTGSEGEKLFHISTHLYMVNHFIMNYQYEDAARDILKLTNEIYELACTQTRTNLLNRVKMLSSHLNAQTNVKINIKSLAAERPKCIYDDVVPSPF